MKSKEMLVYLSHEWLGTSLSDHSRLKLEMFCNFIDLLLPKCDISDSVTHLHLYRINDMLSHEMFDNAHVTFALFFFNLYLLKASSVILYNNYEHTEFSSLLIKCVSMKDDVTRECEDLFFVGKYFFYFIYE